MSPKSSYVLGIILTHIFGSIHLYFEFGEFSVSILGNEREKMAKIIDYLDRVDNSELILTGFTGDTGNKKENFTLGGS